MATDLDLNNMTSQTGVDYEFTPDTTLKSYLQFLNLKKSRTALCDSVIPALVDSISSIAQTLRSSSQVSQVGNANAFGDDQLNVDVSAEKILRSTISKCPSIHSASSEEDPVERSARQDAENGDAKETYSIAFDPLDGSSIIASNWTVGTILGIWEGESALHQHPSRQIAAILGVYGPRTTAVIALRVPGWEERCFEISIDDGEPKISIPYLKFGDSKTKYFAPANLRAASEDDRYMKLVNHFISERYTLRYSGGLVPDVVHALVKGHGMYVSPVTANSKAKLRRLYELAPVALVVECAGGDALDEQGKRVLDAEIAHTDERGGFVCGSREDVDVVRRFLDLA